MGYPLAYQQQPRGLKISGANPATQGVGTTNDTVVSFTAAAVAGMTNLGTWPIATWCIVTQSDTLGTTFQITRQGIYEVRYSIPFISAELSTIQSGITLAAPDSQLIIDPDPVGVTVYQTSSFTTNTADKGTTLTGTAKVAVRPVELDPRPVRPLSIVRLQASDGADGPPPSFVNTPQITLWIQQVNHLNG